MFIFYSDVNECEEDASLCTGEKQSCKNTDGSYECQCEDDLIYDYGSKLCIPKPVGKYDKLCCSNYSDYPTESFIFLNLSVSMRNCVKEIIVNNSTASCVNLCP